MRRDQLTSIESLIRDKSRGSLEIFEDALKILSSSSDPCGDATRLTRAHPEMSALEHLRRAACSGSLDRLREFYSSSKEELARTCSELLSDMGVEVVATLSRSSAVLNCLRRSEVSSVVISESRPGLEGVRVAEILRDEGFSVTLVVDALLPWYALKMNATGLVGADRVTEKYLINKAGTLPLATLVRTLAVPSLLKLHRGGYRLEEKPPDEIATLEGVKVVNIYFDETPLERLDRIVFEGLVLRPNEIDKAFRRLSEILEGK